MADPITREMRRLNHLTFTYVNEIQWWTEQQLAAERQRLTSRARDIATHYRSMNLLFNIFTLGRTEQDIQQFTFLSTQTNLGLPTFCPAAREFRDCIIKIMHINELLHRFYLQQLQINNDPPSGPPRVLRPQHQQNGPRHD